MHKYKINDSVEIIEGSHAGKIATITKIIEREFDRKWFDVVLSGQSRMTGTVRLRESDVAPRA